MIYLLDTNVISETIKKSPNKQVLTWLRSVNITHFSLSVVTLGEIRKGVEQIAGSAKKQHIIKWLEIDLAREFLGRIINIDQAVADKWGYILARYPISAIDGLIAATALVHNMKLVTRNTKGFHTLAGLELIDPWRL
jgi:hypothetical protein